MFRWFYTVFIDKVPEFNNFHISVYAATLTFAGNYGRSSVFKWQEGNHVTPKPRQRPLVLEDLVAMNSVYVFYAT